MRDGLKRDLRTVVISAVTASVFVGVPATAAIIATNSDKVDGKHAVGANATKEQRAKKLVATDKLGLLPNDILAQAPDSNLLDGMDSSDFMSSDDAWAYVIANGSLHATSGNITVTHPAVGQYCVVVEKRGSHKAAQVTLADPGGTRIVSVGTGHGSACNPLFTATHDAVPVYVMTTAGAAVDANFTIYVPAP